MHQCTSTIRGINQQLKKQHKRKPCGYCRETGPIIYDIKTGTCFYDLLLIKRPMKRADIRQCSRTGAAIQENRSTGITRRALWDG